MSRKLISPIIVLMLAVLACNVQTATPTPIVPTAPAITDTPVPPTATVGPAASDTPVPPTAAPGGLTLDMLKNATYHTPFYNRTVTLVNGMYTEGTGASSFTVQMEAVYAFGDLNGDGKADAAVLLTENGGGSGVFVSLIAVVNQAGAPHQIGAAQLGDRVQVNSVDISSAVIHLDMLVQGPSDPMCCPSLAEKQNYWLIGNGLWLMRVNTTTGGVEHIIDVDSPGIWTTVTNPFTVTGTVTVLPFENTLAYKIYTTDGTKVNEGSLMVTPGSGTSGSFTRNFDLSSAGISDWVIIQFIDTSAADGSIVSLGSVILKAH
ncbi:MAG TPA: Gmad2 immunoglobulin-like domain-containing protein [Anaerolineales bacterium]|nr:Gmad2 immunoglobulin-like domain-containing protein [Anaerolineales bacterium]